MGPVYVVCEWRKNVFCQRIRLGRIWTTQDKNGERKQLFQHISIDGNRLIYKSFTATGELFDRLNF